MNITVLVKPVPYKSVVDENGNVVRQKVKNIISKFDKCAIEEALQIKEKTNGTVCSLAMSIPNNVNVLKETLAYGIDKAILLSDPVFAGSDTNATSYILSQALKKIKSDLVICGKISSDSATSQVGIGVAAKLDIPFIYDVCKIIEIDNTKVKCKVICDDNYEIIECKLPCVIIVNDTINIPRIPTINNRLLAETKGVTIWKSTDFVINKNKCGFNGSVTNVIKTTPIKSYKDTQTLDGDIANKINRFLEVIKSCSYHQNEVEKFDKGNKSNLEYWIYDDNYDLTCRLITKAYRLSQKTSAKIVIVSFNKKRDYFKNGADKIINISTNKDDYLTKSLVLENLISNHKPNIFLFNKSTESKILSAYLAAKLNMGLSADCMELELDESDRLVQIRSAYGGRLLAHIVTKNCDTQMATVLPVEERLIYNDNNTGEVENIISDIYCDNIKIIEREKIEDNYFKKDVIITCGMGAIKQLDNLKRLAAYLNASLGVTRDVCDKGYLDSNYLIGQSGRQVNPKIYIAFGVSGALEHTVGIKSDIIISINTDNNAPIIKLSDYYINEDVNEFIPLLLKKLEEENNGK